VRGALLLALLAALSLQTPMPWGALWVAVPLAVAASLLLAWRYGAWAVAMPVALFGGAAVREGAMSLWAWWIPVACLSGVWMGLREEGEGPTGGERAWMLLPVLLLAAGLPWAIRYPDLVARVDRELRAGDVQLLALCRQLGYPAERLSALRHTVDENAALRLKVLPHVMPSVLFVWVALLVAAGRALSSRAAGALRWPALSGSRLRDWRLPDGAIWVLLAGLALALAPWPSWGPTAWTLVINALLGFCVQGIAVVESLLLARGVPPSIIVLTLSFVFAVAMPVFMLTAAAVGVSDVWLDYRRLEPAAEPE
jgi:hypothetical protein